MYVNRVLSFLLPQCNPRQGMPWCHLRPPEDTNLYQVKQNYRLHLKIWV